MEDAVNNFILLWIIGLLGSVTMVMAGCPEKCQCNLNYFVYCKQASINDNQLRQIMDVMPSDVRLLDLGSNRIVNITEDIFSRLPNLEYLNLSDNLIVNVEIGAFQSQRKLRDLNLQRNLVTKLKDGTFKGLVKVKTLNLAANKIQKIEARTFSSLDILHQLYLQENNLDNISSHMFEGLDDLHYLDLSHNDISTIGEASFSQLNALWDLRLSHNKLGSINAKSFDKQVSMRLLDLSHNQIENINFLASCQFRETIGAINLSHNSLSHLPSHVISSVRRLATLDLSQNQISSISGSTFFGLSLLKVNLSGNDLLKIDRKMFANMRKLVHLDLSYNNLQEIKTGAFDSFRETAYYLNVQNNFLSEINPGMFRGMKNLLTLNLDNNSVNNIYKGSFEQLVKLEELRISNNKLTKVLASMLKGPELQALYLHHNNIEKFSEFKFEHQQTELNVFLNMSAQERNESAARLTWPYQKGSQIYWKIVVQCVSHNNCSAKPPGHEEYLPPYKTETVLTNLTPNSQYFICVYPVFLNKNIKVEQCVHLKTQPGRSLTTATSEERNSQSLSDSGLSLTHYSPVTLILATVLVLCSML